MVLLVFCLCQILVIAYFLLFVIFISEVLSKIILKRHRQMNITCEYRLPTYKSQTQEQPKLEPKTDEKPLSEANSQTEQNTGENPHDEQKTEANSSSEPHTEENPLSKSNTEENPSSEPHTEENPLSKSNTDENPSSESNQTESQVKQPSTSEDIDQSGQGKPDFVAESDQLKSDEDTKDSVQQISNSCNPDWKITQGVYTGVMVFVGDYWGNKEKPPAVEDCTRLILNNPSGGFKLLLLLMKILTRHAQAVSII